MLLVFSSTFLALSIFIYGQSFDSRPYFSGKAIARFPVVSNDLHEASPLQGVSAPVLVRAASGSVHSGGGTVALPVEVLDVQNLGQQQLQWVLIRLYSKQYNVNAMLSSKWGFVIGNWIVTTMVKQMLFGSMSFLSREWDRYLRNH